MAATSGAIATTVPSRGIKEVSLALYNLLPRCVSDSRAVVYVIFCATIVLSILFLVFISEKWHLVGHRRFNPTIIVQPATSSGSLPTFVIHRGNPGRSWPIQSTSSTLTDEIRVGNLTSIYKPTSAIHKHLSPGASGIPK